MEFFLSQFGLHIDKRWLYNQRINKPLFQTWLEFKDNIKLKVGNDKKEITLGYKIVGCVVTVPFPNDYVDDGVGKLHFVSMGGFFNRGRFDNLYFS
jgi:hypothetical protein